ncbi:hypothetical protein [Massilia sp.]|uniref:hypothetical protein n=1 Tax=Massilia sp. TaxID=1882437 RepID=UPI0028A7F216|nr:hypothetical protein [Massilia sp.]
MRGLILAVMTCVYSVGALAQESAYADLDACTKDEQIRLTAKGAAIGLVTGLGGALFSGKKDKALKAAAIGAAAGGVAGFATAYYTAIDNCNKKNPQWITESSLVRDPSKSYQQVKKEHGYQAREGIKVHLNDVKVPASVQPGERFAIDTIFDVMTPTDAETEVVFQRKLFVTTDGKEAEMPFPSASSATRVVEAGRSKETIQLPTPPDAAKGTTYRIEISAAAGGKPPTMLSRSVNVI